MVLLIKILKNVRKFPIKFLLKRISDNQAPSRRRLKSSDLKNDGLPKINKKHENYEYFILKSQKFTNYSAHEFIFVLI